MAKFESKVTGGNSHVRIIVFFGLVNALSSWGSAQSERTGGDFGKGRAAD
ncbi:MAG: hypothetical protein ACJ74Y_13795 [Bryobacteraceae bacterium]